MTVRDPHGQPLNRRFNRTRVTDRTVDELLGLCRGMLADGAITDPEAQYLQRWMEANRSVLSDWPGDRLYSRLCEMLADRTLDIEEQGELLDLLHELTGGPVPLAHQAASRATSLPLCNPRPEIHFPGKSFCLTGKFVSGSRKQCEGHIVQRGGIPQSAPTQTTSYLVIGFLGSSDWIHSSYGRKIEAGVALRERGVPIHIVAEEHWAAALVQN